MGTYLTVAGMGQQPEVKEAGMAGGAILLLGAAFLLYAFLKG